MARPYSEKFLTELREIENPTLGVRLGRACVKANIPAAYAALVVDSTRSTLYAWFRGRHIRKNRQKVVEDLIKSLEDDLIMGRLPAKSMADAESYIKDILGFKP